MTNVSLSSTDTWSRWPDGVRAAWGSSSACSALVNGDTRGLIKLVADASTDRLLGVHVLADGAGEVVQAGVSG